MVAIPTPNKPNATGFVAMPRELCRLFRYEFSDDVPIEEVEATLLLSIIAAESLHGSAQVRLDASHFLDTDKGSCVIDAGTPVGRDLNRLFVGFVCREFGEDAFTVERLDPNNDFGFTVSPAPANQSYRS